MGPFDSSSDSELVRLAVGGELKAFDALIRRYHRRVYALAVNMLRDHDSADDVCQEAFLRAYRALGRFRQGANFYTWMYRITANLCLNSIRDRKKFVSIGDAPEAAFASDPAEEGSAAGKELTEKVDNALEQIDPKYRIALILRAKEGLSYEQISAVLGVPKGTVMSRISRAREKLRAILEE